MSAVTSIRTRADTSSPQDPPFLQLRAADEGREISAITRNTVQAAIEVLAGTRPVQQLARRLDQRCLNALQHRASLIRREAANSSFPAVKRLHRNPAVRSVRVCEVSPDVYEASAVVVDELRARAVAVRLERSKQVWRITALEIG
ncbi:Rv3235 family protein [Micrococcaceae bacterium Sec5.7]